MGRWRSGSRVGFLSELADAEVSGGLLAFPDKGPAGVRGLTLLALQDHPIARLDVRGVAGERV